jgi:hypothetical protein
LRETRGVWQQMKRYEFTVRISPERFVDYYRGTVQMVQVRCTDGHTLRFPASLLQRFVTEEGIHGDFVLTCDGNNKCIELRRVEPV